MSPEQVLQDAARDALDNGLSPEQIIKLVTEAVYSGLPGHGPKGGDDAKS